MSSLGTATSALPGLSLSRREVQSSGFASGLWAPLEIEEEDREQRQQRVQVRKGRQEAVRVLVLRDCREWKGLH